MDVGQASLADYTSSRQPTAFNETPDSSYSSAPNATAGPSMTKPKKSAPKKPRDSAKSSSTPPSDEPPSVRNGESKAPKKRKANRACAHCQKAHLTCDDSRPCQRCVKRGIADTCIEGHRKKAKYLLDEEELEALKTTKGHQEGSKTSPIKQDSLPPTTAADPDSLFNLAFDPAYTFGSQTANLEYSILSAILGNPSPDSQTQSLDTPLAPSDNNLWPTNQLDQSQLPTPTTSGDMLLIRPLPQGRSSSQLLGSGHLTPSPDLSIPYNALPPEQRSSNFGARDSSSLDSHTAPGMGATTSFLRTAGPPSPPPSNGSPEESVSALGPVASPHVQASGNIINPGDAIYTSVAQPYDYTQGYHFLMRFLNERSAPFLPLNGHQTVGLSPNTSPTIQRHPNDMRYFPPPRGGPIVSGVDEAAMRSRFEKNDILRVVRALAIFRPSLIALQMPMSEADEVFVERALQRSLLELEKLISFSGTPTAIWRRTGEICVVGLEFTMLTEWSKEDLVGSRKFIYELFENQSVVEYWENFASHAFENSTQSVYSHCVLLKPSGEPVPCAFCFTIRRDMFDLPNLIIGQWLPLFL